MLLLFKLAAGLKRFQLVLHVIFFFLISNHLNAQSVRFNGISPGGTYVNLGNDLSLRTSVFTIEAWIKIEGDAVGTATSSAGGGGFVGTEAIPIVARGRGEAEVANVDINYFFGIKKNGAVYNLIADFEDQNTLDNLPTPAVSLNHSGTSTGTVTLCTWTHVAVTYGGPADPNWRFYINGSPAGVTAVTGVNAAALTPETASISPASIGSALQSGGTAAGFFNGRIDEVRIWNNVRTQVEIDANKNLEISIAPTELVARYALNENTSTVISNSGSGSGGSALAGTIVNTGEWVTGWLQGSSSAIDFDGVNDLITMGAAPALNTANFTLEAWIKIEGAGNTTSTGTGGIAAAIPIVTKGIAQAETPANVNMNYFMGITAGGVLVADFEDAINGGNHPVIGNTTIPSNVWTHVAVTYSVSTGTWKLYLNGIEDKSELEGIGISPEPNSIQHFVIGSELNSTGVHSGDPGYFNGKIDEVRVWGVARTILEIQGSMNLELTSGTNLLGRWGLDEPCPVSTTAIASVGPSGTLTGGPVNSGAGYNPPPYVVGGTFTPVSGTLNFSGNTSSTTINDANNNSVRVRYYLRKTGASSVPSFGMAFLPDTQFYTEEPQGNTGGANISMFNAQTDWILANKTTRNLIYVGQLGDCTQNGDNPTEWLRARDQMYKLEKATTPALPADIPYGICVGNHDQFPIGNADGTTTGFNLHFGEAHFTGKPFYGGHYGSNNDNHYQLVSYGGIDFIIISLEYDPTQDQPVLDWANTLLQTFSTRKAIIMSHYLINANGSWGTQGQAIYNALRSNPNLFLMLCGHVSIIASDVARRTDTYNGNTVVTLLSDYQSRSGGGHGLMRLLTFNPASNTMNVETFSPYDNSFELDANNTFTSSISLGTSSPFELIQEFPSVAPGSTTNITWPTFQPSSQYEWFVEMFDGENTVLSQVQNFTTAAALPISLLNFKASPANGAVKLEWSTSSESKNHHFDIERSANGNMFSKIGEIPGKGDAQTIQRYSTLDNKPLKNTSYYRLKQVDIDGKFTYSWIATIFINEKNSGIDIFPNPVTGSDINIQFRDKINGKIQIMVIDAAGKILYSQQLQTPSKTFIIHKKFPPGVYTISFQSDEIKENKKIVVL